MAYRVQLFINDQNSDRFGYPDTVASNVTQETAEAIKDAFDEAFRGMLGYGFAIEVSEEVTGDRCLGCGKPANPVSPGVKSF